MTRSPGNAAALQRKCRWPQLLNESINFDAVALPSINPRHGDAWALLALLVFGGHAIHKLYTAVMMFGVVLVGTYTSIFIAAPILI